MEAIDHDSPPWLGNSSLDWLSRDGLAYLRLYIVYKLVYSIEIDFIISIPVLSFDKSDFNALQKIY